MRVAISFAALRVKVIISTCARAVPRRIKSETQCTLVAVLPVPAPASTRTRDSRLCATACCEGFSFKAAILRARSTRGQVGAEGIVERVMVAGTALHIIPINHVGAFRRVALH
jgi:hypothetical protein